MKKEEPHAKIAKIAKKNLFWRFWRPWRSLREVLCYKDKCTWTINY